MNLIAKFCMTFSGCVLPLLEEQEVPLLRRVACQAQRADRRQRGPAHCEKVFLMMREAF